MPTFSIHLLSDSAITAKKDRFFTSRNCIYATVAQTSQGHRTKGETKPCPLLQLAKFVFLLWNSLTKGFWARVGPISSKQKQTERSCTLDRERQTRTSSSLFQENRQSRHWLNSDTIRLRMARTTNCCGEGCLFHWGCVLLYIVSMAKV